MNIEDFDQRELNETELDTVSGGKHPAKVTVPDLKLGISYADHQAWADAS